MTSRSSKLPIIIVSLFHGAFIERLMAQVSNATEKSIEYSVKLDCYEIEDEVEACVEPIATIININSNNV